MLPWLIIGQNGRIYTGYYGQGSSRLITRFKPGVRRRGWSNQAIAANLFLLPSDSTAQICIVYPLPCDMIRLRLRGSHRTYADEGIRSRPNRRGSAGNVWRSRNQGTCELVQQPKKQGMTWAQTREPVGRRRRGSISSQDVSSIRGNSVTCYVPSHLSPIRLERE